jgi:uncharacterized protein YdhG (YjbR/CyaY superfamily)
MMISQEKCNFADRTEANTIISVKSKEDLKQEFQNVDTYILSFAEPHRHILSNIRRIIYEEAPDAVEGLTYGMPSYKTNGRPLVYFALHQHHIGFYATPSGHTEFAKELSNYKHGKGSVQFPLSQPIPYDLIRLIVAFRVLENLEKEKK